MFLVQLARKNSQSIFLMLWMAIMPLLCSAILTLLAIKYQSDINTFSMFEWIGFYLVITACMAFALTPTTFVALFSGYFLAWFAVPYMLLAYLAASAIGYVLANFVDHGKFFDSIKAWPKVKNLVEGINHKQISFIILCRISPVLPFAIMNVVLAILKVSFRQFLWAGFLGMLPRTLFFIWLGSTAKLLKELITGPNSNINQLCFLLLLAISIGGFYFYFKNLLNKKLKKS